MIPRLPVEEKKRAAVGKRILRKDARALLPLIEAALGPELLGGAAPQGDKEARRKALHLLHLRRKMALRAGLADPGDPRQLALPLEAP